MEDDEPALLHEPDLMLAILRAARQGPAGRHRRVFWLRSRAGRRSCGGAEERIATSTENQATRAPTRTRGEVKLLKPAWDAFRGGYFADPDGHT